MSGISQAKAKGSSTSIPISASTSTSTSISMLPESLGYLAARYSVLPQIALSIAEIEARAVLSQAGLIESLRLALGLSQADLADRAGCTPGLISHIETGSRKPSGRMALKLAQILFNERKP